MTLVFLDGDRCYWRSGRFMEIIYEQLEARGITRGSLAELKRQTEAEGGSFDTLKALRATYDHSVIDSVVSAVEEEAASRQRLPYEDERCLLMPGIRELVLSIPARQRVILTRGGEELQLLKLRAIAGIDVERELYEITDREDKGMLLVDSFVASKDRFEFPWIRNAETVLAADDVVLVEDKGAAFAGFERLPGKMKGYWYQDPSVPLLVSQELPAGMSLPENVNIVHDLHAVQADLLKIR